jgi:hypothetical protein
MKKALSYAKATLLASTLAVLALGAMPQSADARITSVTVYCDGSDNLCATYEDPDVYIEFYLGRALAVVIEFAT